MNAIRLTLAAVLLVGLSTPVRADQVVCLGGAPEAAMAVLEAAPHPMTALIALQIGYGTEGKFLAGTLMANKDDGGWILVYVAPPPLGQLCILAAGPKISPAKAMVVPEKFDPAAPVL